MKAFLLFPFLSKLVLNAFENIRKIEVSEVLSPRLSIGRMKTLNASLWRIIEAGFN